MMEEKSRNTTRLDKNLFLEAMRKTDGYSAPSHNAAIVIALSLAVLLFFGLRGEIALPVIAMEVIVGIAALIWVLLLLPSGKRGKVWKEYCRKHGKERETKLFDSFLSTSTNAGMVEIPYNEIQKIEETEHLAIIILQSGKGIILDRDGFNTDDALTRLREDTMNDRGKEKTE